MTNFNTLPLRDVLLKNLTTLDYTTMTPIQAKSLPIMLEKTDIIAQAKTGSGKTAAFALSLLHHLNIDHYAVQALVLCPTRELAEQVAQSIRQLARLMPNVKVLNLSGGMPMKAQLDSLRHGAHIIVGTPGRVQKHLDKETLSVKHLKTLVLDEADRMLDMGFFDAIKAIIDLCPEDRQTLLFSATYPVEIKKLAAQFMNRPQRVVVDEAHSEFDIEQRFYATEGKTEKFNLLKSLLLHYQPASTLIFCNTKEQTTNIASQLAKERFNAIALNGDMEQVQRDSAIIRFKNGSCTILVATDVAARGLDIKELPAVINYELAFESDVHIHRVGRTGRAGARGLALSLTSANDAERLIKIEDDLKKPLTWGNKSELTNTATKMPAAEMVTLCLTAGKKDKIRPGDILGALTKDAGLPGDAIGKIDIAATHSYVAIKRSHASKAYDYLRDGKLKGKKVGVKNLS